MQNQCGSEPARDEAMPVTIEGDWQTAIASRLAPTGALCCQGYLLLVRVL
jgi:hypothetical protein